MAALVVALVPADWVFIVLRKEGEEQKKKEKENLRSKKIRKTGVDDEGEFYGEKVRDRRWRDEGIFSLMNMKEI